MQLFLEQKLHLIFVCFRVYKKDKFSMSLKLKAPSDLFFNKLYVDQETSDMEDSNQDQAHMKKKRAPACLSIQCPVCGGPAPDHVHFGGENHIDY